MSRSSGGQSNTCECVLCHRADVIESLYSFGKMPVAGYLEKDKESSKNAPRFNLTIGLCKKCGLVQQIDREAKQTLTDSVYSNYQPTYTMSHSVSFYVDSFIREALHRSNLMKGESVVEVGSNDGRVLSCLSQMGFRSIGFEPSARLNKLAREMQLSVIEDYFGAKSVEKYLKQYPQTRLLLTRHTLEHAFDPADFLQGIADILAPNGLAVIEVPYLKLQMMNNQFQSMTFQHVSFFTIHSAIKALASAGLSLVDVAFVEMDAGSMVLYVKKDRSVSTAKTVRINKELEALLQLDQPAGYKSYFQRIDQLRKIVREFFVDCSCENLRTIAYGAGGKGQAMLNMLNLDAEQIPFVIDDTPQSAGCYIPGTEIEVIASSDIRSKDADHILITAPSHIKEIVEKEKGRSLKGTVFIATVPDFHQIPLTNIQK